MAGKVTALRYQRHNRDRVNVYLDGQFGFGLAAIEAARLRVGQTLSDNDIADLKSRDEVERAYERALNFLSYRPRSEAEVRQNLRKKDVGEETAEAVVERLTRAGLLDDREFARYWVENRLQFRPRGTRALRYELRKKRVPDAVIDDALAKIDEEAAARHVADAGARRLRRLEPSEFRRKLVAYMSRRGFSYAVIGPLVEEMVKAHSCEKPGDTESEVEDNG